MDQKPKPMSIFPKMIPRINYLQKAKSRINLSICISPHIFINRYRLAKVLSCTPNNVQILQLLTTSAIHLNVQANIMPDVEEKQRDWILNNLKHQRQDSLLYRAQVCLDQDLHCNDFILSETFDVPNTFVHLRDDEELNSSIYLEKPLKLPLWKGFEVPLLDKDGNLQLDNDSKPITIIAKDPKLVHTLLSS